MFLFYKSAAKLHISRFFSPFQGEDLRMQDIMKLAHQFLQNFCAGNQQNQALLHKHINLFLNPGVSNDARWWLTRYPQCY